MKPSHVSTKILPNYREQNFGHDIQSLWLFKAVEGCAVPESKFISAISPVF